MVTLLQVQTKKYSFFESLPMFVCRALFLKAKLKNLASKIKVYIFECGVGSSMHLPHFRTICSIDLAMVRPYIHTQTLPFIDIDR